MKKASLAAAAVLLSLSVLLLAGCGDGGASGPSTSSEVPDSIVTSSSEAASSDGGQPASSTDTTEAAQPKALIRTSPIKVFAPHDLLSADEAASFVGFSRWPSRTAASYKDEESGVISERYRYDLGGSTIHALVEIHQDGYKKSDGSVKDQFLFEKELSKGEITAVAGLGDDAFTHGPGPTPPALRQLLHRGGFRRRRLRNRRQRGAECRRSARRSWRISRPSWGSGRRLRWGWSRQSGRCRRASRRRHQQPHALHVRRVREHVHGGDADQTVAVLLELRDVRAHGGRVAGDVDDARGPDLADADDGLVGEAGPGRVDHDDVGLGDRPPATPSVPSATARSTLATSPSRKWAFSMPLRRAFSFASSTASGMASMPSTACGVPGQGQSDGAHAGVEVPDDGAGGRRPRRLRRGLGCVAPARRGHFSRGQPVQHLGLAGCSSGRRRSRTSSG